MGLGASGGPRLWARTRNLSYDQGLELRHIEGHDIDDKRHDTRDSCHGLLGPYEPVRRRQIVTIDRILRSAKPSPSEMHFR